MCSSYLFTCWACKTDRYANFHFVDEETEAQSSIEAACDSRYQSQELNLVLCDFKARVFSPSWNLWF